jgi:hypothetical protein
LLVQAGYGVMTTDNLPDALTLLLATQPKLLVMGSELRAARATQTAERFNELANAVLRVELPPDFSSVDAGRAADYLLAEVRAMMGDSGSRQPSLYALRGRRKPATSLRSGQPASTCSPV